MIKFASSVSALGMLLALSACSRHESVRSCIELPRQPSSQYGQGYETAEVIRDHRRATRYATVMSPVAPALLNAYEEGSREALTDVFNRWQLRVLPPPEALLSAEESELYAAYSAFYLHFHPVAPTSAAPPEANQRLRPYVIIQQRLHVGCSPALMFQNEDVKLDETLLSKVGLYEDFRPDLELHDQEILYLTDEYHYALSGFLHNQPYLDVARNGGLVQLMDQVETKPRKAFLDPFIGDLHFNGAIWTFAALPLVELVIFDEAMENAVMTYSQLATGGEAILAKQNGSWSVTNTRQTWISLDSNGEPTRVIARPVNRARQFAERSRPN